MKISQKISEKKTISNIFFSQQNDPFHTVIMGYMGHIQEVMWQIKVQRNGK